jgi:hypothetical protein
LSVVFKLRTLTQITHRRLAIRICSIGARKLRQDKNCEAFGAKGEAGDFGFTAAVVAYDTDPTPTHW